MKGGDNDLQNNFIRTTRRIIGPKVNFVKNENENKKFEKNNSQNSQRSHRSQSRSRRLKLKTLRSQTLRSRLFKAITRAITPKKRILTRRRGKKYQEKKK